MTRIVFILLTLFPILSFASKNDSLNHSFEAVGGIGNYEYLHAGMKLDLKHNYFIEAAAGIKPWGFSRSYMMAYLSVGEMLRKKEKIFTLMIQAKAIAWDYEDKFYHFTMLGIAGELRLMYHLNERYSLYANGGLLYNSMLRYERKTYLEVAWPKEWQPSFSVQVSYRLK